jgi:hypothetical protein
MSEPFLGMRDILLGFDTDIYFEDGDFMTCTGLDYITREIFKLLITNKGSWKAAPNIGCSPSSFIGEENTRENGERLKTLVEDGLKSTVYPGQIKVKVVPTDQSKVMVFIDIYSSDNMVSIEPFVFDFVSGVYKLNTIDARTTTKKSSSELTINSTQTSRRSNQYWDRIATRN